MPKTSIEWTEHTWNPIISGCSIVSPGCQNCYAMRMAARMEAMNHTKYKGLTRKKGKKIIWNGKININQDDPVLWQPLKRDKPTMYFVNSMSDLFHQDVPFEVIDKIMAVIALSPQHTFQVLTKRPERMFEYFERKWTYSEIPNFVGYFTDTLEFKQKKDYSFPLSNLWLGVSIENQTKADERIPYLLNTPAAVRFLSCEPLLGYISFRRIEEKPTKPYLDSLQAIDWVIVGGESGPNARPMHPNWVRSIRNQCQAVGVPFFFKQWGEWLPLTQSQPGSYRTTLLMNQYGSTDPSDAEGNYVGFARVGKETAGRLLDGVEHNEMPHHD